MNAHTAPITVSLVHLPDAPDASGEPMVGLLVSTGPANTKRRPLLRIFPTLAAALAAKRSLETGR
ncbi:hypothetical protein [Teichococcus aestuarii]|uniref:Uncharacterized protein n=1 Tax=Teichococcus aestuarii TaxID=568898 RepID=A0A2U1UZ81_9PROT|nr:hypothetical protein [Pseudoroseomonas aestuarii]PWC26964.1 hypothetical protein CR165_20565 [Pseudoroseomonas aestuarii]